MRHCTLALQVALAAISASSTLAWVPASPAALAPRTSYASSSLRHPLRATVENATEEKTETAAEETIVELQPEFQGALTMIQTQLKGQIPEKYSFMLPLLDHFAKEYVTASQTSLQVVGEANAELCHPTAVVKRFLTGIQLAMQWGMGPNKFEFEPLHKACRGEDPENESGNTVDLYQFGADFFRPCINMDKSAILGRDNIDKIVEQLKAGENVVLFANHQSEADPQVVSCMAEAMLPEEYVNEYFSEMIFVAGHKVTTDPLAVPFSMGRNLICIHSKKHIDADPETKGAKQKQNLRAIAAMLDKFKKGGALLWVAPSGGRDRRNVETGKIPIAPFDSKTIDMFRLIGNKSKTPTHYYTMAMVTYDMCPPPDHVEAGVGEARNIRFVPCGIAVGEECESTGGLESRHDFCDHAFAQCQEDYQALWKTIG